MLLFHAALGQEQQAAYLLVQPKCFQSHAPNAPKTKRSARDSLVAGASKAWPKLAQLTRSL
jgi:hypothetical protein